MSNVDVDLDVEMETEVLSCNGATEVLYIGYKVAVDSDVLHPVEPKKPSKSGPEADALALAAAQEDQWRTAALLPFSGEVTEIVVYRDNEPDAVFARKKDAASAFVAWMLKNYPLAFGPWLISPPTSSRSEKTALLVGHKMREFLQIVCKQVLVSNSRLAPEDRQQVPVRMWHSPSNVYDLNDLLIGASSTPRKTVDLHAVWCKLNLPGNLLDVGDAMLAGGDLPDCRGQAAFMRELANSLQLFG